MFARTSALWSTILILGICLAIVSQATSSVIPSSSTRSSNSSLSSSTIFYGGVYTTSPMFSRPYGSASPYYYYQMIKLSVATSGTYTLTSSGSSVNLYGCLYDTFFDPSNPYDSLISYWDGSSFSRYLQTQNIYIFVVTTSSTYSTSSFTITASGPGTPTLQTMTTTTRYGYLSSSNPTFSRPGGYSSHYYYDSYEVTADTTGTYSFRSNTYSSTNAYGCLYDGSFDDSYPSRNKLVCDDNGAGGLQFLMRQKLYSYKRYILVVTTSFSYTTGSYSFTVEGPSSVSLSITTPNVLVVPVLAIVFGSIGLLFLIFAVTLIICVRRRRQAIVCQTVVPPQYFQQTVYSTTNQMPYGNPPPYNPYMAPNKQ